MKNLQLEDKNIVSGDPRQRYPTFLNIQLFYFMSFFPNLLLQSIGQSISEYADALPAEET